MYTLLYLKWIGVHRLKGIYDHYGVYESDNVVYEYGTGTGEKGKKASVHRTTLEDFVRGSEKCFVLVFPDSVKVFSSYETIQRARSRLGETEYNLVTNNCEHFAIWCKTGISESHQIEDLMNAMTETGRQIRKGLQAGLEIAADLAEDVKKRIEEREKEQTKQGTNSV